MKSFDEEFSEFMDATYGPALVLLPVAQREQLQDAFMAGCVIGLAIDRESLLPHAFEVTEYLHASLDRRRVEIARRFRSPHASR